MAKQCGLCGFETIFFIWSSTREFPRENLLDSMPNLTEYDRKKLLSGLSGIPICYDCVKKLKEESE
jgi:hypothetical protein